MVVIAIIAILAALLLPSLRGARERARQLACFLNLRQIGVGIQLYTLDNNGWFPPMWDHQIGYPNYGYPHKRFVGAYVDNSRAVFRCPSEDRPVPGNLGEFDYFVSYGMIAYGGGLFIGTLSGQPAYQGYAPRMMAGEVTIHAVNLLTGQPTGLGMFDSDLDAAKRVRKLYTPYMLEAEYLRTHVHSLTRVRHGVGRTVMNYLGFDLQPRRIDLTGSNWGQHLQAGPEDPNPSLHSDWWYRADGGNWVAPGPNWPFKD